MKDRSSGTTLRRMGMLIAVTTAMVVMPGCSGMRTHAGDAAGVRERPPAFVLIGASSGGMMENSELTGIDGVTSVDAITSATKLMLHSGIHSERRIGRHTFESGFDYIGASQEITYDMPSLSVEGKRTIKFHQVRIPLTYNYHFSNSAESTGLVLKAGVSAGYTFSNSIRGTSSLPRYDFTDWDIGPLIGVSYFPPQMKNMWHGGLYFDMYIGSRVYEDKYHDSNGKGDHGAISFGVILQPPGL